MNSADYSTFLKMLEELNDYVAREYGKDYILQVRAIGGFSMMVHKKLGNIKTPRTKSRDIDSLTYDYPDNILNEIKTIGEKYGVDDVDGWLNNHWNRTKRYNEEFEYFIKWTKLKDASFSNIEVYYADLESLFMFKIRAIDDRIHIAKISPREQDVSDAVTLLKAMKITNLDHINNETIRNILSYFPYAVNYLVDRGFMKGAHIQTKEEKEVQTVREMEDCWEKYFELPQNQRKGIQWEGQTMRPALFEDMYLAKCQAANMAPNEKIKDHFWNNCVKIQEYEPKYCSREQNKAK